MKKFLLMVLLIFILYYIGIGFLGKEKEIPLKIKKLYLNFTPTMKDLVSYKLSLINCFPEDYYYENSAICFKCEMDACFEYKWVDRGIEKKINPVGKAYLKFKEFNVKVADFYSNGLASLFNCREVDNVLSCDYDIKFYLTDNDVEIFYEKSDYLEVSKMICNKIIKSEMVNCYKKGEANICRCENIFVEFYNNKIRYGYYE